ncbi:sulfotransferase [Marivirga sp. S37H4]|uniref:Sulfotransferase n=1 Tax=Marivirga aurantiaca TaxID=2802615 RepID=A0A934X1C7_9BACT|nr:sulfotransferase [Marivirga aurantiaca]MBK6266525.1 sulfotransferase [Marivirga aurantiaca]
MNTFSKNNQNHLPNLLVAGVAKSGTSSLHQYLSQHSEIFMSKRKEPRFITSQVMDFPMGGPKDRKVESWYIKDFESYKNLFSEAKDESIRGESSADTFYFYEKTIPVIKQYLGDPKIIIILRNPVSRAFSAYQHLRRDEREHLSFEEALEVEYQRIRDNYELIYHYKAVSMYADALTAFLDNFSHVKVVINEELSDNPHENLKEIFNFLGVESEVEVNTATRYNLSGIPRFRYLHEMLFEGKKFMDYTRPVARFFFSAKTRKKISRTLMEKNLQRTHINEHTKIELIEYFREDIQRTEKILNRNLSHWLS